METIYSDIAARTGGNIYIGVVGPVRTGKSTLIKRIMEKLVIPNIEDPYRRERAQDELPQSGSGKTIMTSEPKFVPEEAVEISPDGTSVLRVRMIDSVGYMVDGAVGATEDGVPRMVATPWYDEEIPMTQAAELGTKKVMEEHCSIGLVVTTDGTVTDIPRQDYKTAEDRAIRDMQATGKPFLVVINSREPQGQAAAQVREQVEEKFGITPVILDAQALETEEIHKLLGGILYSFPMQQVRIHLPRWLDALEPEHPVKAALYAALRQAGEQIHCLGQAEEALMGLKNLEEVSDLHVRSIEPGKGLVSCTIALPEGLFYEILSSRVGTAIENDAQLMELLWELSQVKKKYDQIAEALSAAQATGYGIVMPTAQEMTLEPPELTKKGSSYGIRLKAGAPSIHMIRVDIDTELSPTVGGEQQSKDLLEYLSAQPDQLWQSNIFGRTVYDMVRDGLNAKLMGTSPQVQEKLRGSLTRIVNDGANGLICLIF